VAWRLRQRSLSGKRGEQRKQDFGVNGLGENFQLMPIAASAGQMIGGVRLAGDEDYATSGDELENADCGFNSGDTAHDYICNEDVGPAHCGDCDRILSAADGFGFVTAEAENLRQRAGDDGVIIGNQNAEFWGSSLHAVLPFTEN
jgi:hypothetical protein